MAVDCQEIHMHLHNTGIVIHIHPSIHAYMHSHFACIIQYWYPYYLICLFTINLYLSPNNLFFSFNAFMFIVFFNLMYLNSSQVVVFFFNKVKAISSATLLILLRPQSKSLCGVSSSKRRQSPKQRWSCGWDHRASVTTYISLATPCVGTYK